MKTRFAFFLVSAVFLATALTPGDAAKAVDIIKGPYLQQVTPDSMVIMWETDVAADSQVDYSPDGINWDQYVDSTQVTIHEVALTKVASDTVYDYTVTSGGTTSTQSTFATAPASPRSFRFVAYGDSRSDPSNHAAVVQSIINSAPEIVIHMGDIVYNGRSYDEWGPQFFDPAYDLMINTPVLPVLGNHEYSGSGPLWFFDFFSLPGNEEWFAFTYANVRFIGLNTNESYFSGSAQYNWLVGELQSSAYNSATWHIVYLHHSPYSASSRHVDDSYVKRYLVPLFDLYGVDIVFSGHTHAYERYCNNGIYYIVTAGGGAELVALTNDDQDPIRQYGESVYHYCVIDVNVPDSSLTLSARYNNGVEFDTITLSEGAIPNGSTNTITPPKGPIPNAPSNLTATAVSIRQIDLSWVDNSTDEEGFKIDRSLDGINYTLLATVAANVTTYSVTDLTPSTKYYYDVYAYNANGNSDYAKPSATTPSNQPPLADAKSVTTPEDTPVAIKLTGSDPDGDLLTYTVVTNPTNGSLSGTGPNLTYTPNFNFNGSDSFTFKANDGTANSNVATVSITVNPVNDDAPAAPTVSLEGVCNIGKNSATLRGLIDDDGGGCCQYRFYYGTGGGGQLTAWSFDFKNSGESFSVDISGLTPGSKYYFFAWAKNSAGQSSTVAWSFTTLTDLLQLEIPKAGHTLIAGSKRVISWKADPIVSEVLIEYSTDNGGSWNTIDTVVNTPLYGGYQGGWYVWDVPPANSSQCLMRISDTSDPSIFDMTDGTFSIVP